MPDLRTEAEELYREILTAKTTGQAPMAATLSRAEELSRDDTLDTEWRAKLIVAIELDVPEGTDPLANPRDEGSFSALIDQAVNSPRMQELNDEQGRRSGVPDVSQAVLDDVTTAGVIDAGATDAPTATTAAGEVATPAGYTPSGPAVPVSTADIYSEGSVGRAGMERGLGPRSPALGTGPGGASLTGQQRADRLALYADTPEGQAINTQLTRQGFPDVTQAMAQRNIAINYRIDSNGVGARTTDGHSRFLSWPTLSRLVDSLPHHELVQLQERLWDAGFYHGEEPNWGIRDGTTRAAFLESVQTASLTSDSYTWDEMIDAYTNIEVANQAEEQQQATEAALRAAGVDIQSVSDPAAIRMNANDQAQQLIGRDLSLAERDAFASWIRGLERSNNASRRDAAITVASRDLQGSQPGGGAGDYNSERVGQVGAQLGGAYGLTVASHMRTPEHNARVGGARNSDHLRGMAVDLAGDPDKMEALYRWAKANEGPNGLFRIVLYRYEDPQGHSDHVHLSFNTHVRTEVAIPGVSNTGVPVTGYQAGLNEFMQAVRTVESGGNYRAIGPQTRYGRATGAYQFLDSTWNGYGGYNSAADAPQALQDERAAQLMMNYYRRFGDWQLVAVAWHAGPGAAERAMRDRTYLDRISDGIRTTGSYAAEVMSLMAGGGRPRTPTRFYPAQERRENMIVPPPGGEGGGKKSAKILAGLDSQTAEGLSTSPEEAELDAAGAEANLEPAIEVEELNPEAHIREELVDSQEYADFGMALSIEDFNRLLGGPVGLGSQ